MGIMDQRAELIATEIEAAEKSRIESKKLLEEQRNLLKEARNDAQAIVENAREQGEAQREDIVNRSAQRSCAFERRSST